MAIIQYKERRDSKFFRAFFCFHFLFFLFPIFLLFFSFFMLLLYCKILVKIKKEKKKHLIFSAFACLSVSFGNGAE